MTRLAIRVVKVGGSLLDLPDLGLRLHRWLAAQPAAHHVLITGGGALVEQVRAWHDRKPIDEVAAHWMCIDLMTVTAHLLHDRLPDVPLVENDVLLCQRIGERGCTLFGPADWLRHSEPRLLGMRLPASWDTTSDAIAGRLAVALLADELVLLKSQSAPSNMLEKLSHIGYCDPMLLRLSEELPPVRVIGFRQSPIIETILQASQ